MKKLIKKLQEGRGFLGTRHTGLIQEAALGESVEDLDEADVYWKSVSKKFPVSKEGETYYAKMPDGTQKVTWKPAEEAEAKKHLDGLMGKKESSETPLREEKYRVSFAPSHHELLASIHNGQSDPLYALVSRTTNRRSTMATEKEIQAAIEALRDEGSSEAETLADDLEIMLSGELEESSGDPDLTKMDDKKLARYIKDRINANNYSEADRAKKELASRKGKNESLTEAAKRAAKYMKDSHEQEEQDVDHDPLPQLPGTPLDEAQSPGDRPESKKILDDLVKYLEEAGKTDHAEEVRSRNIVSRRKSPLLGLADEILELQEYLDGDGSVPVSVADRAGEYATKTTDQEKRTKAEKLLAKAIASLSRLVDKKRSRLRAKSQKESTDLDEGAYQIEQIYKDTLWEVQDSTGKIVGNVTSIGGKGFVPTYFPGPGAKGAKELKRERSLKAAVEAVWKASQVTKDSFELEERGSAAPWTMSVRTRPHIVATAYEQQPKYWDGKSWTENPDRRKVYPSRQVAAREMGKIRAPTPVPLDEQFEDVQVRILSKEGVSPRQRLPIILDPQEAEKLMSSWSWQAPPKGSGYDKVHFELLYKGEVISKARMDLNQAEPVDLVPWVRKKMRGVKESFEMEGLPDPDDWDPQFTVGMLAEADEMDERTLEVEYLGLVQEPGGKLGVAITINGHEYHYTPTAVNPGAANARMQPSAVAKMGKKVKKLLALSPGKALAWLERNATAYAGTKDNPIGDHNRGHLLPDPGKKLKKAKDY